MQYNTLGNSGLVISQYALGTMTFGSVTSPDDAQEMVRAYTEAGGNFIETADIYNEGTAETIVGGVLAKMSERERADIVIATKGRFPVGVGARDAGLSRRHLSRALENSLRRLGVEHVDLYQLHAWDPLTPLEESLGFLDDAVHSGKISYGGLSNFTGWQIAKAASWARGRFPLVSMQPQYNLLVRETEYEIIPSALDAGIGILPWSPLGGGWLTGKYKRDERPTGSTRLGENPEATGMEAFDRRNELPSTRDVLDCVQRVASELGISMSQVALAWLKARPGVSSVILGARTTDQLRDNLAAAELTLSADQIAALDRASEPAAADYPYGPSGIEQRSKIL